MFCLFKAFNIIETNFFLRTGIHEITSKINEEKHYLYFCAPKKNIVAVLLSVQTPSVHPIISL